jgi:hypothetical protein
MLMFIRGLVVFAQSSVIAPFIHYFSTLAGLV